MTESCDVTFAMSSILSTRAWDVGTHTTSLPAWPTCGSNGFCEACACAYALAATRHRERVKNDLRMKCDVCMACPPAPILRSASRHGLIAGRCPHILTPLRPANQWDRHL